MKLIPILVAAAVTGILATAAGGHAQSPTTAICGDSWGSDGHPGPWYVNSNQSLHGNTLVIGGANCGAGTMWNVTYEVVKENPDTGQQYYPIMQVKNGDGPTSFSISVNPVGCNPGWPYYTQVRNNVTGNWIRKPLGSVPIC